jgi:hypothetical protein
VICVYALIDPRYDVVKYIGQTTNKWSRWRHHCKPVKSDRTKRAWWIRGLIKSGHKPVMIVLEEFQTLEEAGDGEAFWISSLLAAGAILKNHDPGGVVLPKTSEWRAKISAALKGRPLSAEHRTKIAIAATRRKMSTEAVEKSRRSNIGRKQSSETVEKRRHKLLGQKRSEESCLRIRLAKLRAFETRRNAGLPLFKATKS